MADEHIEAARELYNQIDLAWIKQVIQDKCGEHLHLDFKTVDSTDPFGKGDDRNNLYKALSGYANSDGGVIVWGVATRKIDDVDCAAELKPIHNLRKANGKLNEFTPQGVEPPVDGVLHEAIPDSNDNSGYVKTLVPRSERPHMAQDGRYYKRNGDSFIRLHNVDVEDMFGRRARPILKPSIDEDELAVSQTENIHSSSFHWSFRIRLGISNVGRGIAKSPYMKIETNPPLDMMKLNTQFALYDGYGLPIATRRGNAIHFCGPATDVIHPGVTREAVELVGSYAVPMVRFTGDQSLPDKFEIAVTLAAEGFQLAETPIIYTRQQINNIWQKNEARRRQR